MEELEKIKEEIMTTDYIAVIIAGLVLLIAAAVLIGFFVRRSKMRAAPLTRNEEAHAEPILKCVGGALNGKSYPIADGFCIGTDAARCKAVYPGNEPGIGAVHCQITPKADGGIQLTGTDASAETFINGVAILPNVPYSMPVGSSFAVGSLNNIFIVAESVVRPKKTFGWVLPAAAGVLAAGAAAVILLFTFGKETYTGVTGKSFAIPEAGSANLVLDGKAQTGKARYASEIGGYGFGAEKILSVSMGTDRFVSWYINSLPTPLEPGASFLLADLSNVENYNWIGTICDETNVYYSIGEYLSFENCGSFEDASLTVLAQNGEEITFYFYLKMTNCAGESHTIEGVAHTAAEPAVSEPYTGVSGKTFAIPDVGSVNLAYDGKEQSVQAFYGVSGEGDGPRPEERILGVHMEESGIFTEWGYVQWNFDDPKIRWEAGTSLTLSDMTDRTRKNSLSVYCNGVHYDEYGLEEVKVDEMHLNVLSLDGDEMIYYFYLKMSRSWEQHTLEGVARAVLLPGT